MVTYEATAPRSRAPKPRSPSDPSRTTFSTATSTAPGARETGYDSGMHTIDIIRVSITLLVFVASISLVSTGDLIFGVMGHDTPDQHRCESTFSGSEGLGGRQRRALYAEETWRC
jgi:hypothetical protein